jgi:hypothetical protein
MKPEGGENASPGVGTDRAVVLGFWRNRTDSV